MPLLDHFHPPWDAEAPWESIGSFWVTNVARFLNTTLPRDHYRAYPRVHLGHMLEADIAEFQSPDIEEYASMPTEAGLQTLVAPAPILVFDVEFPDVFEIQIHTLKDKLTLSAVIEFVSPSNKDREESRRKLLTKCMGYLELGIGVMIVDTITSRRANFHNLLLAEIGKPNVRPMQPTPTYISAFRPCGLESTTTSLEVWPYELVIGQRIPSVPLPLKSGLNHMIDFESTYMQSLADQNIDYPRNS